MITVEIRTSGLDLEQVSKRLAGPVRQKFVELMADVVYSTMRELAPVRSGALRGSISKSVGVGEASVGPTVPYALYVEYGTAPHMIFPVYVSCLTFFAGGRMVFTGYVSHPGTRPQPFVRYAVEEAERAAPTLWNEAVEELTELR